MMKNVYRKKLGAAAKAAKAKIQKSSGGDQFKNLKDWVAFYKENERLPSQKITCSACKKKQTSMFGDNLKRQLAKPEYKTIELLLTKFECSDCRKAKAPAKEVKAPKVRKAKAGDITAEVNTKEDYLTVEDMEDRKEKVRATLPKFNPDAKPYRIDFNDPLEVAELTRGACQRPDIYLDAGCAQCPLSQHCACVSKDLKRKGEPSRRSTTGVRRGK
jgi:hypothetical protein